MDQRMSMIILGVKDLAVSKQFYVQGLGWKPVFENDTIVFFQTGAMMLAMFLRDDLATDFEADAKTFGRATMVLGYNVRTKGEVDPLLQRAAGAGAAILKPAKEAPWGGYSGYFADPDSLRGR